MNEESRWYPFFLGLMIAFILMMLGSGRIERNWMSCARSIDALTTPSDTVTFLLTHNQGCIKYLGEIEDSP